MFCQQCSGIISDPYIKTTNSAVILSKWIFSVDAQDEAGQLSDWLTASETG